MSLADTVTAVVREKLGNLFDEESEGRAFVNGFYKSVTTANPRPTAPDSQSNVGYWKAGVLLGTGVQAAAAIIAGWAGSTLL